MSVSELELPQTFRLKVQRVRFLVEVMLRTRLKDPVPVDFVIKRNGNQEQMCRGRSSELCIVRCNLLLHAFTVKLEGSPYVTTEFSLAVTFEVDFEPRERRVMTKVIDGSFVLSHAGGADMRFCNVGCRLCVPFTCAALVTPSTQTQSLPVSHMSLDATRCLSLAMFLHVFRSSAFFLCSAVHLQAALM